MEGLTRTRTRTQTRTRTRTRTLSLSLSLTLTLTRCVLREWRTEIRACCAAVLARCGARRGRWLSPPAGRGRRAAPAPEQSYTPEANAIEVTSPPPARGDNQRAGGGVSTPALPPPASEGVITSGAGLEAGRSTAGLDAPPPAGTRRVAWAEEVGASPRH